MKRIWVGHGSEPGGHAFVRVPDSVAAHLVMIGVLEDVESAAKKWTGERHYFDTRAPDGLYWVIGRNIHPFSEKIPRIRFLENLIKDHKVVLSE